MTLEARVDAQNASRGGFLWIDQDPQRLAAVRKGEIQVQQIHAPQIDGGTIEDWIGGAFLPQATLPQVLKIDQDYANYAKYYAPEIVQARVLSHDAISIRSFTGLRSTK